MLTSFIVNDIHICVCYTSSTSEDGGIFWLQENHSLLGDVTDKIYVLYIDDWLSNCSRKLDMDDVRTLDELDSISFQHEEYQIHR